MNACSVWVFNGAGSAFPSGVFSSRDLAVRWISEHRLSGTLTEYPLDVSVYDWVIGEGKWQPKKPEHSTSDYIGRFSSGYQDHYHFENGEEE